MFPLLLYSDAQQINHLPHSLLKKVTENAFDVAPAGEFLHPRPPIPTAALTARTAMAISTRPAR
jgi:hypothetical protein